MRRRDTNQLFINKAKQLYKMLEEWSIKYLIKVEYREFYHRHNLLINLNLNNILKILIKICLNP